MTNFSDVSIGLADAVQIAARSVVTVQAERPVSGTVVGPGLVLTVAHVLHGDEVGVVTADGQELQASVAGRDPTSDLALLKVDGLTAPALSASQGVRVGELLLAVGRPPHGTQATLGFMERELGSYERGWLHSGAAPFRGVSGGALVDARSGLVGILNAGLMRGQLLALPAERAFKIAGVLGANGRVPRGYLGVATQPVHLPGPDSSEEPAGLGEQQAGRGLHGHGGPGRGVRPGRGRGGPERWGWRGGPRRSGRLGLTVVHVEPDSPAQHAGLKVGDILLALNGDGIAHPRRLHDLIRENAGQTVTVRVLRGGEEQDISVTIGEK